MQGCLLVYNQFQDDFWPLFFRPIFAMKMSQKICPAICDNMTSFRHSDMKYVYFMKVDVSANALMVIIIVICHTVSHEKNFNLTLF